MKEVARVAREEDGYNHYTPLNASQETVRFLVVVGIYSISKRVYLVMFMWSH